MRLTPVDAAIGMLLDFMPSRDTPPYPVGGWTVANPTYYDTTAGVPNWGGCEVMCVASTSSSAIAPGRLVTIDKDFLIADAANTAVLDVPIYITLSNFSAGNVTKQYGFILRSGICPVQYAVAATTGKMYIGGAGQATPTAAAGKEIRGGTCLIAATGSFTRPIVTSAVKKRLIYVSSTNGMYIGMAVSGTGVGASAVVSTLDPGGRWVTVSVDSTATGSVTGTFTHTGFGICDMQHPTLQGQIT